MPSSLGPAEIFVILVVALIVLGPKRLPEAGRQVGKALSEIRRWSRDLQGEVRGAFDTSALSSPPQADLPTSTPTALPSGTAEAASAARASGAAQGGDPSTEPAADDTQPARGDEH